MYIAQPRADIHTLDFFLRSALHHIQRKSLTSLLRFAPGLSLTNPLKFPLFTHSDIIDMRPRKTASPIKGSTLQCRSFDQ